MRIVSSRWERAATGAADEPRAPGPDVVFAGRSNVGKSSLINRLLGQQKLARTSAEPGRTRSVNFYRVNEACYFVDLPGYGYAKVSRAERAAWRPLVEGFFERRRRRIALALLVVDARRETTDLDAAMRDWLDARDIAYVVAATKADKLTAAAREQARVGLRALAGRTAACAEPILVSVRTGLGIRELWSHLDAALERHRSRN